MCTYPISLDEDLVLQAEKSLQIKESFQTWLQQQVELWLIAQVNGSNQHIQSRHGKLSDEVLAEKLKDFAPLKENDFPELEEADYKNYLVIRGGQLIQGLEKWL